MKICLLVIGKTDAAYIRAGIEEYEKRMGKYVNYEMKSIIFKDQYNYCYLYSFGKKKLLLDQPDSTEKTVSTQ